MLHIIATPIRIRAAQYAAAMGIKNGAWKAYSTPESLQGLRGHVHILPGCSGELIGAAKRAHDLRGFDSKTMLVDLTSVS